VCCSPGDAPWPHVLGENSKAGRCIAIFSSVCVAVCAIVCAAVHAALCAAVSVVVCMRNFWPFGIAFILLCTMVSIKVPALAKRKVAVRALEHLLMKYKQDTKSDAFDTITTPGGGETLNMLPLEDLIGLRHHDWMCKRTIAHLSADKTVAATLKDLTSNTKGKGGQVYFSTYCRVCCSVCCSLGCSVCCSVCCSVYWSVEVQAIHFPIANQ